MFNNSLSFLSIIDLYINKLYNIILIYWSIMGNIIGLKLITSNKKIKKLINKYIDYNNHKRFSSIDKINNKRYIYR